MKNLKMNFLNKEFKLVNLDNDVIQFISENEDIDFEPKSIFEYDIRQMLEDSFCYQYKKDPVPEGYNFEFKIVEDNEYPCDIIVKVTRITKI